MFPAGDGYRARGVDALHRADVDVFLELFEQERARLQSRIEAADERAARARAELARTRRVTADLRATLLSASDRLAALEDEHQQTVAAIEHAADGEVALLLADQEDG